MTYLARHSGPRCELEAPAAAAPAPVAAAAPAVRSSSTSWYTTAGQGSCSCAGWLASKVGCHVTLLSTRATCRLVASRRAV